MSGQASPQARVRRLLRADGQRAEPSLVVALAAAGSAALLRRRYLAWWESQRLDPARSVAGRLEGWLGGAPDDALDLARAAGIDASALLGTHELVLDALCTTLSRCLDHDLREQPAARARAESLRGDFLERVVRAAEPGAWAAAQASLLNHPRPDSVIYFTRFWVRGFPLSPLRRAYVEALGQVVPDLDPTTSVVGWAEAARSGHSQDLLDWEAVAAEQESFVQAGGSAWLPLRCGLRVPVEPSGPDLESRFSALELLAGPRRFVVAEEGDATADAGSPAWAARAEAAFAEPLFAVVDRLLVLLGRAALGARAGEARDWLPPLLPEGGRPEAGSAVEPPARLEQLGQRITPLVLSPGADPGAIAWAMAEAGRRADARPDSPLAEAVARARRIQPAEEGWVEAWAAALHALALDRWTEALSRLLDRLEVPGRDGQSRSFRALASGWLRIAAEGLVRKDRSRRPAGIAEEEPASDTAVNRFSLDLVDADIDCRLVRHAWPASPARLELGTWIANEWREARELLRLLAERAGLPARGRSGIVWIHHLLLDARTGRRLDAFKRVVSAAGLVPWCLCEVDEAVEAARPPGEPPARWRRQCAESPDPIPDRPWTAARSWLAGHKDLSWLARAWHRRAGR